MKEEKSTGPSKDENPGLPRSGCQYRLYINSSHRKLLKGLKQLVNMLREPSAPNHRVNTVPAGYRSSDMKCDVSLPVMCVASPCPRMPGENSNQIVHLDVSA